MLRRKFLVASVAAILTLQSVPAAAQTEATEEIIVTARKREESILRVPVIETAITQDSLEKYQTNDLYAVANRVPGFVMGESVGTVGIQTSLRGIGPTSQTATVDQSVSLNIDGLPLTQGYAFTAGMFDVAQVEVLKGPQALFYGKNSTAGVISLRSADPTDEFEFIARGGNEFEAEEKTGELIVSGPVAPSLKLRLAARFSDMEGFFRNNGVPIPGLGNLSPKHREFAPKESWILRGTALFEPNDIYEARLKVNYVDDRMEGSGGDGQIILCPDGTGGVPPRNIPFIGDSDCRLNKNTQLGDFDPAFWPGVRNDGVPFMDSNQAFGTLEQDVAISPDITLTSCGRTQIKSEFAKFMRHIERTFMMFGTPIVEVGDGFATSRTHVTENNKFADGRTASTIGIYYERFVDEGDRWRFKWRHWNLYYIGPPDFSAPLYQCKEYGPPPGMPGPEDPTTVRKDFLFTSSDGSISASP